MSAVHSCGMIDAQPFPANRADIMNGLMPLCWKEKLFSRFSRFRPILGGGECRRPFTSSIQQMTNPAQKQDTGWSKETVDYKFLLTGPNFFKSVITQWFLESLYREVLVFWCFKNARCGAWNFAFPRFSNIKRLLHHTKPEHSDAPLKEPKH